MSDTLALPTDVSTESCPWDAVYVDCGGECGAYANYDDPAAAQALWEAVATDLLWNWTGRVFGVCEVTVRPCGGTCPESFTGWSTFWGRGPGWDPFFPGGGGRGPARGAAWYPVLVSGRWFNITCGCIGSCTCEPTGPTVLSLPGPIQSVTEVRIDGQALPSTAYRVDRKRWLIRTDGGVWPRCQNMLADPAADPDTFEVTYEHGIPVPIGGQVAVGRLACELALSACGEECALPERIQSLSRQGISMTFQDLTADTIETGIWSIDSWVDSATKPRPYASVKSVDTMRR